MNDASGEQRNAMALAMSAGTPVRRTGYCSSKSLKPASLLTSCHIASPRSVTMCPGHMALTVMPSGPKSVAIWRVSPTTAALPASYTSDLGAWSSPCTDEMLTIRPTSDAGGSPCLRPAPSHGPGSKPSGGPDSTIAGTPYFAPRYCAPTSRSIPLRQASGSTSTALPSRPTPPP